MIRSLWKRFVALFERTETEEDEESRFVPSPLDWSVRVGHGGGDDEAVRELSRVNERAQTLEESHDER